MSLTDTAETQSINWLTGNPAVAPVTPLMVRLMTANGSDAAAGTECTGDGYTPQQGTFSADTNPASNTSKISYGVLDSTTQRVITGFEIWDSAATPVRWWHVALTTPLTVAAGEQCEFAVGALTLTQS